ncbi:MAG: NAD-dependent epimerase/dehydratase family protein [Proteobacteria bacterium]|nr:NAD-dependent epimerase/dehydratase family protein [Pseudomonadota bacterium]
MLAAVSRLPRIVITGGCGFLGSHLAERLAGQYQVCLFDNLARDVRAQGRNRLDGPEMEIVVGDVRDRVLLERTFAGASAVLHLAAIAGVSNYRRRPVEVLRVNLLGTVAVIDAVIARRVRRLLYFSTSEVYGPDAMAASETSSALVSGPVSERRWVYAVSKVASEHFVLRHAELNDFAATCVRPFNIYGPRQVGEGAISNFARCLVRGEPLMVEGDGNDIRAWCYVDDLVDAVQAMLESEAAAGCSFNVGNPEAQCATSELARRMIAIAGRGSIHHAPAPETRVRRRVPDIGLAAARLGFRPKVGLDEGLRRTIAWFETDPV